MLFSLYLWSRFGPSLAKDLLIFGLIRNFRYLSCVDFAFICYSCYFVRLYIPYLGNDLLLLRWIVIFVIHYKKRLKNETLVKWLTIKTYQNGCPEFDSHRESVFFSMVREVLSRTVRITLKHTLIKNYKEAFLVEDGMDGTGRHWKRAWVSEVSSNVAVKLPTMPDYDMFPLGSSYTISIQLWCPWSVLWGRTCEGKTSFACQPSCDPVGGNDDVEVRILASRQCGPGLVLRSSVSYGPSLLVLFLAPRGFSPGTPVFPSPQKPTFLPHGPTSL